MRQFVFINGCGACGKDTFVALCQVLGEPGIKVYNYTTINTAKIITGIIGRYIGGEDFNRQVSQKSDRYRSALSAVKQYLDDTYDTSIIDLQRHLYAIDTFDKRTAPADVKDYCIFIHCREPENIKRMIDWLIEAGYADENRDNVHTLLITGRTTPDMYMNESDRSVYEYDYDTVISNCSTYESLKAKAVTYMEEILHYKMNAH